MSDLINSGETSGEDFAEDTTFKLPPEKKVIFYNDDYTTMEFVTDVLISIFDKSSVEAEKLMLQVHESGSAIVGTYTYDIAVSRANLTKTIARKNGFPLRVEIE